MRGERKGRERYNLVVKRERSSANGTLRYNPYGKREKSMGHARPKHTVGRQGPIIWQTSRDPHPVGRQDPTGKQRPSPTRAPTRTSRRGGIGQGDLPHTRDATSVSRMHGNHKEQYGSHSLNRWQERFALQHRHAGMSTGSEPYTLRGILDKGVQTLMTRLGPFHERGPGTQQHIGPMLVSEFSVHIYYTAFYQCVLSRGQIILWVQHHNVFYRKEDKPMVRTVTLIFHTVVYQLVQCVLLRRGQIYEQGSGPILFFVYNVTT